MSAERSELSVCTMLPVEVAVTVSVSGPTFNCSAPTGTCSFGGTIVLRRSNVAKPASSTRTV